MSLITGFLKLFKSGNNTNYNQEEMFNKNWDKIDVKAKSQSEQIENLKAELLYSGDLYVDETIGLKFQLQQNALICLDGGSGLDLCSWTGRVHERANIRLTNVSGGGAYIDIKLNLTDNTVKCVAINGSGYRLQRVIQYKKI